MAQVPCWLVKMFAQVPLCSVHMPFRLVQLPSFVPLWLVQMPLWLAQNAPTCPSVCSKSLPLPCLILHVCYVGEVQVPECPTGQPKHPVFAHMALSLPQVPLCLARLTISLTQVLH